MDDYYNAKGVIKAVAPKFFKPIKTDYVIMPTDANDELFAGVGSYNGAGRFTLNTKPGYSLQKWNVTTLTMHEAGFSTLTKWNSQLRVSLLTTAMLTTRLMLKAGRYT